MNDFCKTCQHYEVCLHWIYTFKKETPENFIKWCQIHEKEKYSMVEELR